MTDLIKLRPVIFTLSKVVRYCLHNILRRAEDYQKFAADSGYAEAYEKFRQSQEKFSDNPELSEYIQLAEQLLDQTALHYFKIGVKVGLDLGR